MGKWQDMARQMKEAEPVCADSVISANSPDLSSFAAPSGTNGPNGTALPRRPSRNPVREVLGWRAGLAAINREQPLGGIERVRWSELCDDAVLLFNGWAMHAAQLGWSALDMFGVDPASLADPAADRDAPHGLAWRLRGGTVLRMIDSRAQMRWIGGTRALFPRGGTDRCVPMWDL